MHGMTAYFVRRLLLVPLTFLCITIMVYTILRIVPGGPVERAKAIVKLKMQGEGGAGAARDLGGEQMTDQQIREIEEYYKVDRSIPAGYAIWLGIYPDAKSGFSGILQGDFGTSTIFQRSVLHVITGRFRISLMFGLTGFFLTYLVCIPLGVVKAIRHKTWIDTASSIAVFFGYATPGFVACLVLLVVLGGQFNLVPLGGEKPEKEEWEALSDAGKVMARLHHALVPLFGYVIGGFATMTVLMKNSLLENLGQDYVRTAYAKGLSEKRVIFLHALRNSLIPITAHIGHFLGLLFAGSFLIEKVCSIEGMGLLGWKAIEARDYPIEMGILVFLVLISLTGNILSDMIWALIDPRIRFEK